MTTLTLPRPGTVRRTAFGKIVLNEARLTWRRPVGLIGGVAIPVVLLVIFGNVGKFQQPSASLGGLTAFDVYLPILVVFALSMLALLGLPIPLASYRELGLLRRLSTTPVPRSWMLIAQGLVQLGVAVAAIAVMITVAMTAFGTPAPKSPAGVMVAVALSAAGLTRLS